MELMTGLAAIGKSIDIVRALRDLEVKITDAEFKNQVADLYTALSDVKIALADAREKIADQEREILRLKAISGRKRAVFNYRGFNFGLDEIGRPIGRPYCPVCEQKDGAQIQITRGIGKFDLCPRCNSPYGKDYPWKVPEDKLPKT